MPRERPPEVYPCSYDVTALGEMSKAKGSRAERKAIKFLEADGYVCTKAGGSLGVLDVIALGPNAVRCLQV